MEKLSLHQEYAKAALAGLMANHARLCEINKLYAEDNVSLARALAMEVHLIAAVMVAVEEEHS